MTSMMPETRKPAPAIVVIVTKVTPGIRRQTNAQMTNRTPATMTPQSRFFSVYIRFPFLGGMAMRDGFPLTSL